MPIYEYRCTACGRRFTQFSRKVVAREEEEERPQCPNCLSSETKRLVGSFMIQGPKAVDPREAGYQSEQHEREMQMTPREHIEEFHKMTNPDPE